MIKVVLLAFFLFIISTAQHPKCLLQEPLTDNCLNSIQLSILDGEIIPYLCVITFERSLFSKAEQFCKKASIVDIQSGYLYFKILLIQGKFQEAFKTEYNLFFMNSFSHNRQLLSILKEISSTLSEKEKRSDQIEKLPHFSRSIFYFYNNKTQDSLAQLKLHLQMNKDNLELTYEHFLMVRILEKQFQYYDAMNYIIQVIKTNKKPHPYFYHLKGNFLMHHVQFQKAIVEFEKANQLFQIVYKSSGFSFSNYNIGLCYEKIGELKEAIKYYQKSIISLSSAEALNALGHAYYRLYEQNQDKKKIELAQKYYKKSLEINNNYTVAFFNLGVLELARQNTKDAIRYFDQCLSMENTYRSCKYGLIKSYYLTNFTHKANEIINSIQNTQETLAELLAVLYELGNHKKALELAGSRDDYKSSELMEWKGFNEYALELFEQAEQSFNRAMFLGSKKGYVYYSLGLAQFELKKYQDCTRSFDNAYKLDPREDTKEKRNECKKFMENDL